MDQHNSTTGNFGATTPIGTSSATDNGTCAHCGGSLSGQNRGLEEFLGRIGISEEMVSNLKASMQNIDVEEYLNTARDYLKGASSKIKDGSNRATQFTKDNPGKVAAGVAALAVGAGLLLNALSKDRT